MTGRTLMTRAGVCRVNTELGDLGQLVSPLGTSAPSSLKPGGGMKGQSVVPRQQVRRGKDGEVGGGLLSATQALVWKKSAPAGAGLGSLASAVRRGVRR